MSSPRAHNGAWVHVCRLWRRRPMKTISILAVLLTTLTPVGPVRANYGPQEGGWNGEPSGLENLVITRETLTIDLRAANASRWEEIRGDRWSELPLAAVEVLYWIRNDGEEQTVDLVFASAATFEPGEVKVWLNDQPLAPQGSSRKDGRWRVPEKMPAPGMVEPIRYWGFHSYPKLLDVRVTFPRGYSSLRTRYRTPISANRERANPTCFWQYAYLLAPARSWGGFGGLDVTVYVPQDWPAVTEPELQRDGERLFGSFDTIPADALTITTQMPPEPFRQRRSLVLALISACWVVGLLSALALSYWVGTVRGRRDIRKQQPRTFAAWPLWLVGCVWGGIGLALAWLSSFVLVHAAGVPPVQSQSSGGVEEMIFVLIGLPGSLLAIPVGILIAWMFAMRARRRPVANAESV
jgi:hypothetical protein